MISVHRSCLKVLGPLAIATMLSGCGEPRAVMLPLQYPDGTLVTTRGGEPLMAGYQTYGSAVHANTTALYESAKPPTCATCAKVGTVVTEPSVLRQATGVFETATIGAGAVMTGVGIMDNGAGSTDISQNTTVIGQPLRRGYASGGDDRFSRNRGDRSPPSEHGNPYSRTGWGQERSNGY